MRRWAWMIWGLAQLTHAQALSDPTGTPTTTAVPLGAAESALVDSNPTVLQAANAANADRSKSESSNQPSTNSPDAPTVRNELATRASPDTDAAPTGDASPVRGPVAASEAGSPPTVIPFPELPAEPVAPRSIGTPTVPIVYRDLWDRIRAGFRLPVLNSPLVANYERWYMARPDALQRMFERGGRYLFFIVEEIERRGLPSELALLPFVESAMNPAALSSAKAAGLWQFIPSTGKSYDLSQNWWVDNRRDVLQSTNAALGYLTRIYEMQGNDWFLALASYNWGEGAVQRAMRKNALRGRPTDYLSLDMPNETRHYVPKLMALRNIVARTQASGFVLPEIPNEPYFASLEKLRPIDLSLAARFAGMTVEEFVALNPAHNRPVITASRNNALILPTERVQGFLQAMDEHANARKPLASWQPVTIRQGETIDAIARRSGLSGGELRRANGLTAQSRLLPGTRIIAPQKEIQDETLVEQFIAPRVYELVDTPAQRHLVGRQENMQSIANRYGITIAALRAWNGLRDTTRRGMRLIVRPAQSQTVMTNENGDRQVIKVTLAEPDPPAQAAPTTLAPSATAATAPTAPIGSATVTAAAASGALRAPAVSNASAPMRLDPPRPQPVAPLKAASVQESQREPKTTTRPGGAEAARQNRSRPESTPPNRTAQTTTTPSGARAPQISRSRDQRRPVSRESTKTAGPTKAADARSPKNAPATNRGRQPGNGNRPAQQR
jgi:membrane-bound lytic murein transglycosylase D